MIEKKIATLAKIIRELSGGTIALSGGIDSLTLSCFAANVLGSKNIQMVHAVSPAVPEKATLRVREFAAHRNWQLSIVSSGEFEDPQYRKNPVNRCFYCKSNLYQMLASLSKGTVISGANVDDLADYRPGLDAASDNSVRHPYIDANIQKSEVRQLARAIGLGEIAELPASPCLASRIETGVFIEANDLRKVDAVETYLSESLDLKIVRCRIKRHDICLEIEADELARLSLHAREELVAQITSQFFPQEHRLVRIASYRMGSAFLHNPVPPVPLVVKQSG